MRTFIILAATVSGLLVSGCMDPYANRHPGYFTVGDAPLTAAEVVRQDTVVQPRCRQWVREAVPSPNRIARDRAVNGLVAGTVGGALGSLAGTDPVVGTVWGAGSGLAHGWNSGQAEGQQQRFGWGIWCNAAASGGYNAIPQSEGEQIQQTGTSRTYGAPVPQQGSDRRLPQQPPTSGH